MILYAIWKPVSDDRASEWKCSCTMLPGVTKGSGLVVLQYLAIVWSSVLSPFIICNIKYVVRLKANSNLNKGYSEKPSVIPDAIL